MVNDFQDICFDIYATSEPIFNKFHFFRFEAFFYCFCILRPKTGKIKKKKKKKHYNSTIIITL